MVCLPADDQDCLMKQGLTSQVAERKLAAAAKATSDISYDIALAMKFIKDQVSSAFSALLCCCLYSAVMLHFCLVLCSLLLVQCSLFLLCSLLSAACSLLSSCCYVPCYVLCSLLLVPCCVPCSEICVLHSCCLFSARLRVLCSAPCSLFCIPVLPLALARNFMFAGDCLHPGTGIH